MSRSIALIAATAAACVALAAPMAGAAGPGAAPGPAPGSAPFDGTWKTKLDSIKFDSKPDVFELKDGSFHCGNCAPAFTVKADGSEQKVGGHSYYDTVAVKVVDDRHVVMTARLAGKPMYEMSFKVSADGKQLNEVMKDMSGAKVATWNQVSSRVGPGAAGSHAMAGSWKMDKMPGASDEGMIITYHQSADGLQMQYNGASYDAKFDGKPVLTANDPGKTMVSLKRISDRVIEETDTRGGQVTDVIRLTVSDDGKSMSVVDQNRGSDMTMSWTMLRDH
jgi:hypothetical protein